MNEDKAVLTAASWWTDKIRKDCTEQQLVNFREKLMDLIYSEIATDLAFGYDGANVWIICDKYPCEILSSAAAVAGISESFFPSGTDMIIESYDGGKTYIIEIADGRGVSYCKLSPIDEESEE